ncbi:MAG TPA: hypothetical protein VF867_15290 [Arthrobacter sp.]
MKKIVTILLAALTISVTAGCSSAPKAETPAPAATTAAATSTIPKPDAAQTAALRADLAKINPLLDNDKSVDNSRNQCSGILGGSPEDKLLTSTKARFTGGQVKDVSDAEARQILAVIKANGFCKAAS